MGTDPFSPIDLGKEKRGLSPLILVPGTDLFHLQSIIV